MSLLRSAPLRRVPAPILVLAGIASVQTGSAVARTLFAEVGATGVALLRLTIGALVMLVVLRPKAWTWSAKAWRAAALLAMAMAGMNVVFYLSLRSVPLGIAVTVEFLGPLLLALVQTRRWIDLGWAVLAGGGVLLLGLDTTSGIPLTGLLLAFVAGLFWIAYILASAHIGTVLPGVDGLAVALAIAAVIVLPFGASGASAVMGHPSLLLTATAVALLSSVIPYGLELTALRELPTRVFGVLMSLQPAAAAVAGLIILNQSLQLREVLALVMVSVASLGVTLSSRTGQEPAPHPTLD
ncbi:MAG TPA: EamA family transporter [Actinomycetes bacterium]|nr:EamA family transporter [Actinomycetes bacterium]